MPKQVYNIIVNTNDKTKGKQGYITYHKVNSIDKFRKFLNNKYKNWVFATVYDNQTRDKLELLKP